MHQNWSIRKGATFWLLILSLFFSLEVQAQSAFEMGLKTYQQENYSLAAQYFRQAMANDPQNVNTRYYLADSLLKSNRLEEAQAEYQRILEIGPATQAARLSQTALAQLRSYYHHTGSLINLQSNASNDAGNSGEDVLSGFTPRGDDYMAAITSGGRYVRWSLTKMPLRLYVDKNPDRRYLQHFDARFALDVPRALDVWVKALGGQVNYRKVESPENADIVVTWVNRLDHHGFVKDKSISYTAGLTTPKIVQDQLRTMLVQIGVLDIQGKPQTDQGIYETAVHEFGHVLGILGHSENADDVMYAQSRGIATLSVRDLNTIRRLYIGQADISNRPPDSKRLNDPVRKKKEREVLNNTIAKFENLVKSQGNNLNWINLSVNYKKKADQIKSRYYVFDDAIDGAADDPRRTPEYWYNKTINALDEALKQEPSDAKVYNRKALVYIDMKQLNPALKNVNDAIRYDSNNPDYYLVKAGILTDLSRLGEAQNTLNRYLDLAPNSANRPEVKTLKSKIGMK